MSECASIARLLRVPPRQRRIHWFAPRFIELTLDVPLDALPLRAQRHFLNGELGFVAGIVHAHRQFFVLQTEIDDFREWHQLIRRLAHDQKHNLIGHQDVFRAASLIPVSGLQFRYKPEKGPAEPVATAALLAPNSEGRFIFLGTTYMRVPAWLAWSRIALTAWFLLAFVSIILYAPFWTFGGLIKRRRRPAERMMRLWPLIAVLSLLAFVGLIILSGSDGIARLGNLTIYSFGLTVTTLLFAAASLASAVALWRARKQEIRRDVRWYSIAVTIALLIVVVYLAYFGVIGIRTWS